MPVTEVTRIVETGEESERKLYSLRELKQLDEENSEEIDSRAFQNAIELLAQNQLEDTWAFDQVLEGGVTELFRAVGITVPRKTVKNIKGDPITVDGEIWEEWSIYPGTFVLSRNAVVDEKQYLRALKWYLAGKDIRKLPELQWGGDLGRPIAAIGSQIRNFDLRSKDARIIREQGIVVHVMDRYGGGRNDLDLGSYYYEDLSEQTQQDANELLSDLCHEAVRLLQQEEEYRTSKEFLIEEAEMNEVRFDKYGRIA